MRIPKRGSLGRSGCAKGHAREPTCLKTTKRRCWGQVLEIGDAEHHSGNDMSRLEQRYLRLLRSCCARPRSRQLRRLTVLRRELPAPVAFALVPGNSDGDSEIRCWNLESGNKACKIHHMPSCWACRCWRGNDEGQAARLPRVWRAGNARQSRLDHGSRMRSRTRQQ